MPPLLPPPALPTPHPPKNPVTLLDYLSFGIGAIGGAFVSHHFLYSDLGHSIPAGGFAAMGVSRAFAASTRERFTARRLAKRAKAISQRFESTSEILVKDLQARLALALFNWDNGKGDFLTNEQFEVALAQLVDEFNDRQLKQLAASTPALPSPPPQPPPP